MATREMRRAGLRAARARNRHSGTLMTRPFGEHVRANLSPKRARLASGPDEGHPYNLMCAGVCMGSGKGRRRFAGLLGILSKPGHRIVLVFSNRVPDGNGITGRHYLSDDFNIRRQVKKHSITAH